MVGRTLADVMSDPLVAEALIANPDTFEFPEAPELVVTVAPWVPHVTVITHEDGSLSIDGPTAKTLNALATAINFTYTLVRPPDGSWGLEQGNGSWSGMVGQVYRGEADMGLGPFAMTYSRSTAIDFTVPILQDYFRILVKRGNPEPNPWGFLNPFSNYMWLGVLMCGLLMSFLLVAPQVALKKTLSLKQYATLWTDNLFVMFGTFVSQDLCVRASAKTVYIMIMSWFLFCLVVMRSYAGALTSQLSVRYMPAPIKNLEDLVNHPSIKVALEIQTAFSDYLRNADSGLFGQLSKFYDQGRIKEVISPNFPTVMREMVGSGDYVMLIDELTLLRLLSLEFSITGTCDYYLADDRFKPWILSFIGPRQHPIVPALSSRILSIVEAGLYMRWIYEEIPNATSCNSRPTTLTVSEPYGLKGIWGVFVLLILGLLIASVLLACEILNPHHRDMPSVGAYSISSNKVTY